MQSVNCGYCGKNLSKAVKGSDGKYYCSTWHRGMGNPKQPIQGAVGAIVLGLVMMILTPGITFRGTPLYLLLLIAGPIVLLFGVFGYATKNKNSPSPLS